MLALKITQSAETSGYIVLRALVGGMREYIQRGRAFHHLAVQEERRLVAYARGLPHVVRDYNYRRLSQADCPPLWLSRYSTAT